MMVDLPTLKLIAEVEFADIVQAVNIITGDDLTVVESHLNPIPEAAVREFLTFARSILRP